MPRTVRRTAVAMALAFLMAGAVHALPLGPAPTPAGPAGLFGLLETWLTNLFQLDQEAGGTMDPNGQPGTQVEAGCIMDPNGRCAALQGEEGCIMDPDG